MSQYLKIMNSVVTALQRAQGASGKFTLAGHQLELMAQKMKGKEGEAIQKMLHSLESPTLEVGYKAKSNYTIGGFRLRDGKKVVAQGATSVTRPGTTDSVVKTHYSIGENGKILQFNGFVDGGKVANLEDVAMGFSRKGGIVTVNASTGQAVAYNLTANEGALVEGAKAFSADTLLEKYVETIRKGQRALDRMMLTIRQGLKGQQPPAAPIATKAPAAVSSSTVVFDKVAKSNQLSGYKMNDEIAQKM